MNQNFIKSHKNIVLMGAGGILDTYLPAISKVFDVAYITDNDPLKQKSLLQNSLSGNVGLEHWPAWSRF